MRIGIFGRGKLGKAMAARIQAEAERIASVADSGATTAVGRDVPELAWIIDIGEEPSSAVDVAFDASTASAVRGHIEWALATGTSLVVATTGWNQEDLAGLIGQRIGLFVSPNFSLGVALMRRMAKALAEYSALVPGAELSLIEKHHSRKLDAPSGTAKALIAALEEGNPGIHGYSLGSASPGTVSVGVVRAGSEVGYHEVSLDAQFETISIAHQARSRDLFAEGALRAILWMKGRKGFYTMEDLAADLLGSERS